MNYNMEELLPLVGELANKYTSKQSSSITYEKAQQFMEAVLYCIGEYENSDPMKEMLLGKNTQADAKTAYHLGYEMVLQKVRNTKKQYHEMIQDFNSYGNRCCYDTFVRGIPNFFLYYDPRFQPQNHLLTLDYPVLHPMEGLCGIDAVEIYINCASMEQMFLKAFPEEYIRHVVNAYTKNCDDLIINLASITIRNILGAWIAGKEINVGGYTLKEQERVKIFGSENSTEAMEKILEKGVSKLMNLLFHGNKELLEYFIHDLHDFSFELKNAVKYNCLESILALK